MTSSNRRADGSVACEGGRTAPGTDLLRVDAGGWVNHAEHIESPNSDERPPGTVLELIVIHGISLPPGQFGGPDILALFTNSLAFDAHPYYQQLRDVRVSAHFLLRRDGHLVQLVSCLRRAWHAGVSCWRGRSRCNDFSIGIEFEGADHMAYEAAQYQVCSDLIAALARAYPIQAIAGHSDIAPGRKTDPGCCFDWSRLPALSA